MKVLILNGSPHSNGNTSFIVNKLKERFPSDTIFAEINAFKENIKPCVECRYCWENEGCCIKDKMEVINSDDYDVLVIASPLYMSFLTPPLFSIITRLNYIWCNKHFLKISNNLKKKKGILILAGGGTGTPVYAINTAKLAFNYLNADFDEEKDYIYSLHTDKLLAKDDKEVLKQIDRTIEGLQLKDNFTLK